MKKVFLILFLGIFILINNSYAQNNTGYAIAKPVYKGTITLNGDMGWNSLGYKLTKKYKNVLLAHALCREQFNDSHAALYDDFKYMYIYNELLSGKYWLLDPYEHRTGDKEYLLKDGSTKLTGNVYNDFVCRGWTSNSSSDEGAIINFSNGSIEFESCSSSFKIVCVSNR